MRLAKIGLPVLAALLAVGVVVHQTATGHAEKPSSDKKTDKRVLWTTSKVKGSPEPPAPYRLEVAFPKLKFFEPLEMCSAAGTERLFIATRPGKLYSFVPDKKTETPDLLIDVKKMVYGMVCHPKFDKNGYFYVTCIVDPSKETPTGTRVSRFTAKGNPPKADVKSEKLILEWPNGGHNGGCMRFGPDGMLYIGTGDGSGIADGLQTGQDVTTPLSKMLRIDVDGAEKDKGYAIPKDNPFVKHKGARGEIWAYGLRQPWKYSFDRKTGDLWCGEVGQDLWEMVYKIEKGGNYGWSVMEGSHPFRPERKKGPTPILKPIIEHNHTEFRSLTGGYVYHGERLKDLKGAYVYGDFDTGKIWSFRYDGKKVSDHKELFNSTIRLVAWGEDNKGELYLVDWIGGQLHQLVKAPKVEQKNEFPRKLSETGLFTSTKDLKPAPGLIPYSINSQLYSDNATKERYLAIPGEGKIHFDAVEYPQPSPGAPRGWRFPDDTVVVKTFFLDTPKGKRRLETRILHYDQLGGNEEIGDAVWRGYTYLWNDEQTDATLIDKGGLDREYEAKRGDKTEKQNWRFPSRSECTLCHTVPAKFVLGLNTHQLNRDYDYGSGPVNQLAAWEKMGLFSKPLPATPEKLPRLTNPDDEKAPLEKRARAYLHANCAHCHIKWGGGNAEFQLMFTLPLKTMGVADVKPAHGNFDVKDARLLTPGKPEQSIIHHRMTITGLGRMPHVGSRVVDEKGAKLVFDWIKEMK
jgi:uncharacterized repeat protein (TIGR03806 family)